MPAENNQTPDLASEKADTRPATRRLLNLFGHVLAAVCGLLLGYLIVRWFRPDVLPW